MAKALLHLLDILDTPLQLAILIQQLVASCIQLAYDFCHSSQSTCTRCDVHLQARYQGTSRLHKSWQSTGQLTATSAPSMLRESRYARTLRTCIHIHVVQYQYRQECTSMYYYVLVLRFFRQVSFCVRVVLFSTIELMPSTLHAQALPETTESRLQNVT